ncbi:hypothetical protein LCGC14_3101750, partial [marine sediment metagenome]
MELPLRGIASVTNLFKGVSDDRVYCNIGGGVSGARDWNTYNYWHCYVEGLTMTNREFAKAKEDFKKACEVVEIQPTVRQASKWRRKKGKAWKHGGTEWQS